MTRKSIWAALAAGLLFLGAFAVSPAGANVIEWHAYRDGMQRGKFEKKKIFLHFYADWCIYCNKMAETTFKDPEVVESLNRNFIPVRVNVDLDPDTAALYSVKPIPDTWFIYESGEPIGNRPGYISVDQMKVLLELMKAQSLAAQ